MSILAAKALVALMKNWRLALVGAILAVLLAWGGWGELRVKKLEAAIAKTELQAAEAAVVAAATAAEKERLARASETRMNTINGAITDELVKTVAARDTAARTAAERLRQLATLRTASAATEAALAECRNYEGPAVRVIPGPTREALVEFARQADEVADQLRACQRYISEVVSP